MMRALMSYSFRQLRLYTELRLKLGSLYKELE